MRYQIFKYGINSASSEYLFGLTQLIFWILCKYLSLNALTECSYLIIWKQIMIKDETKNSFHLMVSSLIFSIVQISNIPPNGILLSQNFRNIISTTNSNFSENFRYLIRKRTSIVRYIFQTKVILSLVFE